MDVYVTKLSGERELFSPEKLRNALSRAAVAPHLIQETIDYVVSHLRDGIHTGEIYRIAFDYLADRETGSASRYALRKAVMEMGPDGHPFEKLVGELFTAHGFSVETSVILQGKCVEHEVDVVAVKEGRKVMVECKFHHEQEVKSDVKVALYVQARFEDLKEKNGFTEVWLVTNTKLSHDAIRYAECVNMRAVGWSYPREGSFQHLIERAELHPVTCLTSASAEQKKLWLENGVITCKDIRAHDNAFVIANIHAAQKERILAEMNQLCGQ